LQPPYVRWQVAHETAGVVNRFQPDGVLKRLQWFISLQLKEESGPFGDCYKLLVKPG
jgi:hypothetical protein